MSVPDSGTSTFAFRCDDGAELLCDRLLGAAPTYLYLHGFASARMGHKSDSLFAHARARGAGALRVDLRRDAPLSRVVRDVVAMVRQFGPVRLVGASVGAVIAAVVAKSCPECVDGLALIAPAVGMLPRLPQLVDSERRVRASNGQLVPVSEQALAEAAALDEAKLAQALRGKVFVAHGDADEVIPQRWVEAFLAQVKHAEVDYWLVPGGDHRLGAVVHEMWSRMDQHCDGR